MVRKSRKSREEWKIYKNVFDEHTNRRIFELSSQKYFKEIKVPLALGKEANVFIAERHDGSKLIVKIYRLENRNFNNMYYYISSDSRFTGIENQKRKIIFSWVQREYRNLLLAREHIKVPTPIGFKDNIIMMEFIGNDEPARMLKDEFPEDPEGFFKKIIKNMKKLIDAGLVHGDLSDFNILNHDEEPVFIDMSQSTLITSHGARELLERDIKNVIRAFKKAIKIDEEKISKAVLGYFDKKTKDVDK